MGGPGAFRIAPDVASPALPSPSPPATLVVQVLPSAWLARQARHHTPGREYRLPRPFETDRPLRRAFSLQLEPLIRLCRCLSCHRHWVLGPARAV